MQSSISLGMRVLCVCGSASAQSSVTRYASLDSGFAYANNRGGHALFKANQSNMQPDRWGITGVEDMGGGLHTLFRLENGFFTDTGASVNTSSFFNRQAYVGLESGQFGRVMLGHRSALSFDMLHSQTPTQTIHGTCSIPAMWMVLPTRQLRPSTTRSNIARQRGVAYMSRRCSGSATQRISNTARRRAWRCTMATDRLKRRCSGLCCRSGSVLGRRRFVSA